MGYWLRNGFIIISGLNMCFSCYPCLVICLWIFECCVFIEWYKRCGRCIPELGADPPSLLTLRAPAERLDAHGIRAGADVAQTNVSAIFERPFLPGLPRKWVTLLHHLKIGYRPGDHSWLGFELRRKWLLEKITPVTTLVKPTLFVIKKLIVS